MSKDKEEAKEKYQDGNKLYDAQIYDEALTCYQRAAKLDLTFTNAHFCIAKTQIRLQSFENGINYFYKHINLIPEEDQATYAVGLSGILLEEGQKEKALALVKEYIGDFKEDQLFTFLKVLLVNGKMNAMLLHLLNLPQNKANKLYQQLVNEKSIAETYRKKLQQEYLIPAYHQAAEKTTLLAHAPVEHAAYAQKVEAIQAYLPQGKKDFGDNLQRYLNTLNEKITNAQHLLAERIQNNIDQHNTSRAQIQLDVLDKTEYDPVKLQKLRSSLKSVREKNRNTYLKYGGGIFAALIVIGALIFGSLKLWGPHDQKLSWKQARKMNTVKGYKKYLADYPKGEHQIEAQTKLNLIISGAKDEASNTNSASNNNSTNRKENINKARVTGSDVIIRSDHTTESKVAGVVKNEGAQVQILNEYSPANSNEAILKRNVSVYANSHSIELHKGKAVSILSTSGNRVSVKFATENDGNVTAYINKNDLESISSKKWYKVQTGDNTMGWIYGKFIEEL